LTILKNRRHGHGSLRNAEPRGRRRLLPKFGRDDELANGTSMKLSAPHLRRLQAGIESELRSNRPARDYLIAFAGAAVMAVVLFYAALGVLRATDRLPPPPVSGTWCIDSRLTWLKDNPDWKDAGLIAVGSSATWHNLDFGVVSPEAQTRGGVVNAAPCFLTFNQTRYLAEFLIQRASRVETVMMVLAPRDFQGCSRNPTAFFDPDLVDQFIAGDINKAWLRFRNFRLKDVFLHAIYADERKAQVQFDQFGSGPLFSEAPHTGYPFKPESDCYSELTRLADMLESKDIQFIAVTFPVMQGWAERYDPSGVMQAHFKSGIESAVASTKAIVVDGMAKWRAPDLSFTDPVHLQWPETAAFTRFIWQEARQQGADLPPLAEGDLSADVAIATPMADAITQNTPGQSEGYAAGVPEGFGWCSGSYKPEGSRAPPSDFTAVTGKGQVYPKAGAPAHASPGGSITVANAKTYVHLNASREWVLVQDQATDEIAGAHFVSDFSQEPGKRMKQNAQSDRSVVIGPPPAGYNDHFWLSKRGTYTAGTIDGVYVQMDMRTNDPNGKFVANVGADWWRDAGAGSADGLANQSAAGMSNWVELSTQWTTLRFYSGSTAQLQADPPPPLADGMPETSHRIVRRGANTASPCLSASQEQAR